MTAPLTKRLGDEANAIVRGRVWLLLEAKMALEAHAREMEAAEARVVTLTEALRRFVSVDERIREAQRCERRYGIHIGDDSALGAVFAWIDELCGNARDVLDGTDEGA